MNRKLLLLGCVALLFSLSVTALAGNAPAKVTIEADGPILDVCFSSDGSKIVFAYNNVISVYGTDGTLIRRFGIKDGPDIDVMDYANGTIATFSYTGVSQIDLWDENGNRIKKLGAIAKTSDETTVNPDIETAETYRLLFSRDGKRLVNVSKTDNFGGVKSRDLATGKVTVFKGYDDTAVFGCSFNADGSKFVTISEKEQVRVWDLAQGTLITTFDLGDPFRSSGDGKDVAFLSNGTIVAVKVDSLTLWSSDGKLIKTLEQEIDSSYTLVRASRDGSLFAVAFEDGGLALYQRDGSLLRVFETEGPDGFPSAVTGIAFSPDNKFMAFSTDGGPMYNGEVRLFKL